MLDFSMSKLTTPLEVRLSSKISRRFGKGRIVSFLYFGSRAFNMSVRGDSDYDFMLVLDKYVSTDIEKLRKIVRSKEFLDEDLNLNFLYLTDIKFRGKANFQIRSLSLPFYIYLAGAKLLEGRNIFNEDPIRLRKDSLAKMEGFKIQEYYGRCDKLYFQKITDDDLYFQLRKYTKDICWLLLVVRGVLKVNDLTKMRFEEILRIAISNNIISKSHAKDFQILLRDNFSKTRLRRLEKIRRYLYLRYLDFSKPQDL